MPQGKVADEEGMSRIRKVDTHVGGMVDYPSFGRTGR